MNMEYSKYLMFLLIFDGQESLETANQILSMKNIFDDASDFVEQ